MTQANHSRWRMALSCLAVSALAVLQTACATATIESAVPEGALSGKVASKQEVTPSPATLSANAAAYDSYPNIGTAPRAATTQMTPGEEQALLKKLKAAKASQGGAAASSAGTSAEVKKLQEDAEHHVNDTLNTIEQQ